MNYKLGFQQEISSIYQRHVLVNEVSRKFVDEVQDAIVDKQLPFQNIFGDKLRIVVPLHTDPILFDILDAVSKIKNYSGVDLKSGDVIRKIKLDPKYGGGEKEQKINIGRAINNLEIAEERKTRFLNFLARYKDDLAEESEYSVVISRSPLDVLRMGEIGNTGHCHQQGGLYFSCAIQEAKTGGGIAYIVRTDDIKKLSDDELQYEEIFSDKNRNVDGIDAIARLRILKYKVYKDGESGVESELAIPQIKTYGNTKPNFYNTVLNFLKGNQPELYDLDNILRKYENGDIGRAGGSYPDTSDYELFNRAFERDVFPSKQLDAVDRDHESDPKYDDDDDADNIEARITEMENELARIQDNYSFKSDSEYYRYQVDTAEDFVYYSAWAGIKFEDIPLKFSADYDPSGEYAWQKTLPYQFRETPELALGLKKVLFKVFNDSEIDSNDIKYITFDDENNTIEFKLNDVGDDMGDDTDQYDAILGVLKDLDDKYDQIRNSLIDAFGENGLLYDKEDDQIEDAFEFAETLSNSEYDADDDVLKIKFPNFSKGYARPIQSNYYNNKMGEAIENYLEKYYKPPMQKNTNQPTFDKFFEAYSNASLKKLYSIKNISVLIGNQYYNSNHTVSAIIKIEFRRFNKNTIDVSRFIDAHVEDMKNLITLIYLDDHDQKDTPEYKSLYKVYGKLTQVYI